jgi:hypothetical protein
LGVVPRTSQFDHHSLIVGLLLLAAAPVVAAAKGSFGGSARLWLRNLFEIPFPGVAVWPP